MVRRGTVTLALVFALTGCVGSPPPGPLVEFRDGITPITRPSPCEASYALRPADQPAAQPLAVLHVAEGKRVGFRRERDQSVSAVGPKFAMPLEPGAYVWEVVPGSVPPWSKRAKHEFRQTAKSVGFLAQTAALLGLGSLLAEDESPPPAPVTLPNTGVDSSPNRNVQTP